MELQQKWSYPARSRRLRKDRRRSSSKESYFRERAQPIDLPESKGPFRFEQVGILPERFAPLYLGQLIGHNMLDQQLELIVPK